VAAVSVAGQMAATCSTLMAALFGMLLMMLLEERLLTQTMMDEVLLLVIWISWSAVSIRTLVAPDQRLLAREKSMMSSLQMGVAVGGLWLASRACVEHVMRGQGAMAYSSACLWLVVMVLARLARDWPSSLENGGQGGCALLDLWREADPPRLFVLAFASVCPACGGAELQPRRHRRVPRLQRL
jgi:hypothetical protein